jgi:hypothetical protein
MGMGTQHKDPIHTYTSTLIPIRGEERRDVVIPEKQIYLVRSEEYNLMITACTALD